jgi:hypothetical protein
MSAESVEALFHLVGVILLAAFMMRTILLPLVRGLKPRRR